MKSKESGGNDGLSVLVVGGLMQRSHRQQGGVPAVVAVDFLVACFWRVQGPPALLLHPDNPLPLALSLLFFPLNDGCTVTVIRTGLHGKRRPRIKR